MRAKRNSDGWRSKMIDQVRLRDRLRYANNPFSRLRYVKAKRELDGGEYDRQAAKRYRDANPPYAGRVSQNIELQKFNEPLHGPIWNRSSFFMNAVRQVVTLTIFSHCKGSSLAVCM